MNDISSNIKKVLVVFLFCFIGLISYITYFQVIVAPKIVSNPYNKRLWIERNKVLRGTIYDRDMKPLTKSERVSEEQQNREYVGGEMFAHVLGYVNVKYGITGLERKYDSELMATSMKDKIAGFIKPENKEQVGNSLKTTLNFDMQKAAYDLLGDNRGAVVALNPKTGEILAMVSKPSFNPNSLDENWKAINENKYRPLLNRAVSGLYPPGSTFKTVTAVSALENMGNLLERRFQDNGVLAFNDKESLSNFAGEVLGNVGFKEAYVHSSNVIFGSLGLELGNKKLKETAEKFYFNKDTPSDGIVIDNSRFPELKEYEKGNIAQSAIGQASVLATPIEMALVTSTIANDGVMMKPFLVKEIVSSKGDTVSKTDPEQISEVTSKENAKIMKDLMREVVASGTGRGAGLENIQVCGKTGTADHMSEGKNATPHSWFIGFAPYDNPTIAVAVIVEDGGQGGIAAANIASKVIEKGVK